MATQPGTEIKVTPEREVPIMPKATRYHLESRLPVKKVWLSACWLVQREIRHSRVK